MLYDEHLTMFLQVADAGSFSKAADAVFITPSAVIKQINLLEDSLGVRLFDRTHRGLKLTKAGSSLYKDAKDLIRYCVEITDRAKAAMREENSIIRIGTSPMTPAEVLVELWPKLHDIYPGLRFQLVPFENTPENARQILKNLGQNIDVVAGVFDESLLAFRECDAIELSREKLCVAVAVGHPLAKKDALSPTDLYGQKLMLIDTGKMKCVDDLRAYIMEHHPQIEICNFPFYNVDVFNECENMGCLLMAIEKWKNVHPLLKILPVDWEYDMPFGLLHSKTPDEKVRNFLEALRQVMPGGNRFV